MVVQFTDSCVGCDQVSIKQKELERFVTRYLALNKDEIAVGLIVTNKEVFSNRKTLKQLDLIRHQFNP